MFSIPIGLIITILIIGFIYDFLTTNPTKTDIVGVYKIIEVNNLEIKEENYENYELKLKKNGEFEIDKIPYLQNCSSGKYSFDPENLFFGLQCDSIYITNFEIEKNIGTFKIKYIHSDPDNAQNIYFEKIQ